MAAIQISTAVFNNPTFHENCWKSFSTILITMKLSKQYLPASRR